MAVAPSTGRCEVHYRVPRCLLKGYDRAQGTGLDPEDLQAWFDWEEEAHRYRVDSDVHREQLVEVIEGSTVELFGDEHRVSHSKADDFARWGRLGGLGTLRRCGRGSRSWRGGAGRRSALRPLTVTRRSNSQ